MLRLAADENFDGRVVRGLCRLLPELDLLRVQDALLEGTPDRTVLAWAASEDRVVLTHDNATLSAAAWQRVREGESMPGVIEVNSKLPVGQVIEDIHLTLLVSDPGDLEGQILYLPL
jgi:hypothetical protein